MTKWSECAEIRFLVRLLKWANSGHLLELNSGYAFSQFRLLTVEQGCAFYKGVGVSSLLLYRSLRLGLTLILDEPCG